MTKESELEKIRAQIDATDEELLSLISQRAGLAVDVADLKKGGGEAGRVNYYRPEREAQILEKLIARNPGPLPDQEVGRLFREIMSACLALEQALTISYLGPEGTYTQSAALKHFGHSVRTRGHVSIAEIFREVAAGSSSYGVVPVENSIEGAINQTLDLLVNSTLKICGEVLLPIHHSLMSREDDFRTVKKVFSHQQSLAQCRAWLDNRLPGAERIAVSSNAEAALCARDEHNSAAIAGMEAARIYDLPILVSNIEDEPDNTTRFLVLGQTSPGPSGSDKTSLVFANANEPGTLQKSLAFFADNGINMSRIESRPSRHGMWEYVFFIDIDGHAEDKAVARVLDLLDRHVLMLKVLGSYPGAVL